MRLPVVSIIFLFVLSLLIDLYILTDVKKIWKKGSGVYIFTAILCYALLIVAISFPRRDVHADISTVMWLLFSYMSIYAAKLFYMISSLLGRLWKFLFNVSADNHYFQWLGVGLGVAVAVLMWIGASYTRNHIEVTHEEFFSRKLPKEFEGYKIVQLSDLHVGTWGEDTSFIKALVDSVNALNPDLVVFTGDLVNRQSSELLPFMDDLSKIKAKDGVFSILGNHDYGDYVDWDSETEKEVDLQKLKNLQKEMGWRMLNNESVYLHEGGDSILLIGVENWGDPPFPKYGDLEKSIPHGEGMEVYNNDTYKLLLTHNPEHWNQEVSKETNIDLTLSGHTHGMQGLVRIGKWKWSPVKYRYEQWGGRFSRLNKHGENNDIYVNIGLGTVGMPARFLSAYPEITLITLREKK